MPRGFVDEDITKIRRFLKERLQRDYITFRGHETERENIRQLLESTALLGESNSLLLAGPRGTGKTTLVNAIITDLLSNKNFVENTLIVHLNGLLHTDDRQALRSITVQMRLENAVDGKVFGSFAENLAFLLECLKSGSKQSKSVIFILENFDLFCTHHNQTLLYNLFDVSQSAQAPICVLGITCRLDVVELLEKRVKSRFSHRQVFLQPSADQFDNYAELFQELLSIPNEKERIAYDDRIDRLNLINCSELTFQFKHFDPVAYKFDNKCVETWNKQIAALMEHSSVLKSLQALYDFDISEAFLKRFLMQLVSQINTKTPSIKPEQISQLVSSYEVDHKVELLCGLSVLEICLIIAIKHHYDIYDSDPFNFEIVYGRFAKFAKTSSTMQGIERAVVLKAFEHLKDIELILPLSNTGAGKLLKEFEMHRMLLLSSQINQAVHKYQALPTEVAQWSQNSLI